MAEGSFCDVGTEGPLSVGIPGLLGSCSGDSIDVLGGAVEGESGRLTR